MAGRGIVTHITNSGPAEFGKTTKVLGVLSKLVQNSD